MPNEGTSTAESIRRVASIAAVIGGLAALLLIALVAIGVVHADTQSVVSVATSAFAVIGSIVGAYFGVKEGASGTQQAIEGMKEQAARAQAFAAHVPASEAGIALEHAQGLAEGTLSAPQSRRIPRGFVFTTPPETESKPENEPET